MQGLGSLRVEFVGVWALRMYTLKDFRLLLAYQGMGYRDNSSA